jgi:pyruvate ferredoxin oxidoreductase alpha subunit
LGASATGVRVYTATSSQGLLYMSEVVFNIAGMRLPVVMTVANRALSGPLSIWNDHQDSMSMRDAGWVQIFAQTPQEAHDLHLAAYRVAEDRRVLLPVMVCVDGFVLTHSYEPVEVASQEVADRFLPPFEPAFALDPDRPLTLGAYADPRFYTEARYQIEQALTEAPHALAEALDDLAGLTGRRYDPELDRYRVDGAEIVLVAMGTAAQTARIAVDRARDRGVAAGLVALRLYRPFPAAALRQAVADARRVVVLDRAVSLGAGGPVATEVRNSMYELDPSPEVVGVVAGLGGRDVSIETLERAIESDGDGWIDLKTELLEARP